MEEDTGTRLRRLFHQNLVVDLPTILQAFPGRSRCSIFRDLKAIGGHLSSYNHNSRFFTLADVPEFDANGLWQHQGIFFSRQGTLKATVRHLVQTSEAGQTHEELQEHLHVRVYHTLLDLVRRNEVSREELDRLFLYVHADPEVRANQVDKRRHQIEEPAAIPPLGPYEIIEVLLCVIWIRSLENTPKWYPALSRTGAS